MLTPEEREHCAQALAQHLRPTPAYDLEPFLISARRIVKVFDRALEECRETEGTTTR